MPELNASVLSSARTGVAAIVAVSAVVVVGGLGAVASHGAGRQTSTWPPADYRFTGWMSAAVGLAPHHAFVEGDAVVLRFQDAANERPTRYRVCWSRLDGSQRRCWSRVARSFRVSSVQTGGPTLHFGRYVTRWYVGGRFVASWSFLFSKELGHP